VLTMPSRLLATAVVLAALLGASAPADAAPRASKNEVATESLELMRPAPPPSTLPESDDEVQR
jgi:hypothetical protein